VLLYDADCRVCRFVARTALRLDMRKELAVLPLQDEEAARLLDVLPPEERLSSWRLVRTDGSLAGYGAGVSELLGSMWVTRAVGRAASVVPDRALDGLYEQATRRRGRLGRIVPRGPAPRRYP
jgi:predicted DCC family thiol-disulfide oxidoreductase YuxK